MNKCSKCGDKVRGNLYYDNQCETCLARLLRQPGDNARDAMRCIRNGKFRQPHEVRRGNAKVA